MAADFNGEPQRLLVGQGKGREIQQGVIVIEEKPQGANKRRRRRKVYSPCESVSSRKWGS